MPFIFLYRTCSDFWYLKLPLSFVGKKNCWFLSFTPFLRIIGIPMSKNNIFVIFVLEISIGVMQIIITWLSCSRMTQKY